MARRLLRDIPSVGTLGSAEPIERLRADVSSYLDGARALYVEHQERMARDCDLALDGCLNVDELARTIYAVATNAHSRVSSQDGSNSRR